MTFRLPGAAYAASWEPVADTATGQGSLPGAGLDGLTSVAAETAVDVAPRAAIVLRALSAAR